jgi:hypothetical protein
MEKAPALRYYSCIMIILISYNVAAPLASDRGFLAKLIFLHTFS